MQIVGFPMRRLILCLIIILQETRRRQQAEAAEKRKRELEGRGVKDPEALKRKQQRREEIEKQAEQSGGGDSNLKVLYYITKTCPCNIQRFFSVVKIENFVGNFLIFFLFLLKT